MAQDDFNERLIREAQEAASREPTQDERALAIINQWFEHMSITDRPVVAIEHRDFVDDDRMTTHYIECTWKYAGHQYTALLTDRTENIDGVTVYVITNKGHHLQANTREQLGQALLVEREGLSAPTSPRVCPENLDRPAAFAITTPSWSRPLFSVSFI